ncbi:hypothetical protein C8R44DRAFT_585099, partial [Mycena epipterygia]
SIEAPLTVYIRILIAHSAPTSKAADFAFCLGYLESFLKLRSHYEWSAVLAYHMAFSARRRREMATGSYIGWRTWTPSCRASSL